MSDSWVVDQEYLAVLERKLKVLKDPKKTTAKQVVSDIAARKEHQVGLAFGLPSNIGTLSTANIPYALNVFH